MAVETNATGAVAAGQDSANARAYNRQQRWLSIAEAALGIVLLSTLLLTGWTANLRDFAVKGSGDRYSLALMFYVVMLATIAKLAGLALDYYSFRLEHRYHLSNQRVSGWLMDQAKSFLVGLTLGVIGAEVVYFIIRTAPVYWWVFAWLAFVILFVLLAQLAPVVLFPLFYRFTPLENEELKQRLVRLAENAGAHIRGVYEWKLSEKSKKANAALAGLGATRRIILSDTLLEHYSDDEIEAVLAHELGHHVHRHIFKGILLQAAITGVGFWLASVVLDVAVQRSSMFSGAHDFANLPLLALVSSGLSLLLLPALNAFSRAHEREADRYCWKVVPNVQPFIRAMSKLSEQNLAERNPSRLVEVLFHSHPPISQRVDAAEAWVRSHANN